MSKVLEIRYNLKDGHFVDICTSLSEGATIFAYFGKGGIL